MRTLRRLFLCFATFFILGRHAEPFTKDLPILGAQLAIIPGATHWFDRDGDVQCRTIWANSVISSITHLRMAGKSDDTSNARSESEPS